MGLKLSFDTILKSFLFLPFAVFSLHIVPRVVDFTKKVVVLSIKAV